jgi:anti-sigma B factor antagonist
MGFRVLEDVDGRVFRLIGELDMATADELVQRVESAVQTPGDIYLDLEQLEFMDSSGVHALLALCKRIQDGGRVVLRSPSHEVTKLLALVGADMIPNLVFEPASRDRSLSA